MQGTLQTSSKDPLLIGVPPVQPTTNASRRPKLFLIQNPSKKRVSCTCIRTLERQQKPQTYNHWSLHKNMRSKMVRAGQGRIICHLCPPEDFIQAEFNMEGGSRQCGSKFRLNDLRLNFDAESRNYPAQMRSTLCRTTAAGAVCRGLFAISNRTTTAFVASEFIAARLSAPLCSARKLNSPATPTPTSFFSPRASLKRSLVFPLFSSPFIRTYASKKKAASTSKNATAEPAVPATRGRIRNNLKMGVVGLPNVGKSSLFNLMTEQAVAAENYPFCTIEPNEARCPVPDARYDYLCDIWKPDSMYPAYLQVTDIAGLIRGASEGEGLGNAFLSHIQAVDGIYHVIRAYEDEDVVHVDDSIDPIRDLETIRYELHKKDMEIVEKARATEELAIKKAGGVHKPSTLTLETIPDATRCITVKPAIYLVNLSKDDYIRNENKWLPKIRAWVAENGGGKVIPFSVEYEQALWDAKTAGTPLEGELSTPSQLPNIIRTGYSALNLIYFFTAGEQEVRAWAVYNGALAPQAAGVIHSDFERGFIKAEVVAFEDFKALSKGTKSMAAVKAAGKFRQEGKTYVVKDGDIIHFQFNVTTKKKK
ncbi:P-loop containing nucleoside triphosphate hydrolase protein [Phlyctochytrium arcticum]|nr:P-loop containing nucleoside triphosphate hydrolase protein [Phlyctochytrium arcticum]